MCSGGVLQFSWSKAIQNNPKYIPKFDVFLFGNLEFPNAFFVSKVLEDLLKNGDSFNMLR